MIRTKSKQGAMELSVGTIVVFVLAMSVLVLGFFLVQQIFDVATGAVDLTDQQLKDEINKLFTDESRISIYPGTKMVEVRQGESDGVGIGIQNLQSERDEFGYDLSAIPGSDCPASFIEADALNLITLGRAESGVPLTTGDAFYTKVIFNPEIGDPLCTIRYRVYVTSSGGQEFNDFFDIKINAA